MKKNRRCSSFLLSGGCALIIAAFAWAGVNVYQDRTAGQSANRAAVELYLETEEMAQNPDEIPDYVDNPEIEMPVTELDGEKYIGMLTISAIGVRLPIIDQWNYRNLRIAPCRYSGSAYLDDLVIAAHNYRSHFGRLRQLKIGDEINFTDIEGNVFHYQVAEVETLPPTAVKEMKSGEWPLTLFTCTAGGQNRIAVRCEKWTERMEACRR